MEVKKDDKHKGNGVAFSFVIDDSKAPDGSASFVSQQVGDWVETQEEGKLAIDILQTEREIIVLSTMAGAITGKINVHLHGDLLTIRGEREVDLNEKKEGYEVLHQECFWGVFSRSVVLPCAVFAEKANAEYKNGILKITIPRRNDENKIEVVVVEE